MFDQPQDDPSTQTPELKEMGAFVYGELRRLATTFMTRERRDHTMQVTELVNEAVARIAVGKSEFVDQDHFFATAAVIMRHALVDHAKKRLAAKRGGVARAQTLISENIPESSDGGLGVIEVDLLLNKLKEHHSEAARCIELYYFGGYTIPVVARLMHTSTATVNRQLRYGRAWFRSQLGGDKVVL